MKFETPVPARFLKMVGGLHGDTEHNGSREIKEQ